MQSDPTSIQRDPYWEEKTFIMRPCDLHVTDGELELENLRLAGAIAGIVGRLMDTSVGRAEGRPPRSVLEVGVGRGDLTTRLLPFVCQRGGVYYGIDSYRPMLSATRGRLRDMGVAPEDFAGIIYGEAASLTQRGAFEAESAWLVIWGKLGEHLVRDADSEQSEWAEAIEEVKKVLEPGGYFLLYEPLQDFNERHRAQPRKRNGRTIIRTRQEYQEALRPLRLIEDGTWQFFDEVYTVALWQKSSDNGELRH